MSKPFLIGSFTTLDVKDICFDSDLGLYLRLFYLLFIN